MVYVKYDAAGNVVEAYDGEYQANSGFDTVRHTVTDMSVCERVATQVSEALRNQYIAIDNGENHYPRYDVIRAPQVGDKVSYAFNGDYYPCGQITKISKSLKRIETSEGKVFYRKKMKANWVNRGTWNLVQGHIDERNPHF